MSKDREEILALCEELNFPALNEWGKDRIEAFYHAAIQQYKDSILALAGEPVGYRNHYGKNTYGHSFSADDYACKSEPLYTADQVLAACKPLEDEVERLFNSGKKILEEKHKAQKSEREVWGQLNELRQQLAAAQDKDTISKNIADRQQQILSEKDAKITKLYQQLSFAQTKLAAAQADNERLCSELRKFRRLTVEEQAAAQAQIQQYREALKNCVAILSILSSIHPSQYELASEVLALPADNSALEAIVKQVGEVMRERCAATVSEIYEDYDGTKHWHAQSPKDFADVIRALPGVTIGDLQK